MYFTNDNTSTCITFVSVYIAVAVKHDCFSLTHKGKRGKRNDF